MEKQYKYMVCTSCMTYNHAPYIVDAMNGFSIQETSFPVVYLITDDASTDGEPEVIRQYLSEHFQEPYRQEETENYYLLCAIHKTNPNCNFVVFLLKYNHRSIRKSKLAYQSEWRDNTKYIAQCEGDDYWIHPKKLQMQVYFMEKNSEYTLCFTNVDVKSEIESLDTHIYDFLEERDYIGDELIKKWTVPFCTMLFKAEIGQKRPYDRRFCVGDNVFVLTCADNGRIHCINKKTGIYRRAKSGWTAKQKTSSEECMRWIIHYKALCEYFPKYADTLDVLISMRYSTLSFLDIKQLKMKNVLQDIYNGVSYGGFDYFKFLIDCLRDILKR